MKYAATVVYSPDDPKLAEVRPIHRKYLGELNAKGSLVISGPFSDGIGGALLVYEAASKDEAESLLKADPFVLEGVVKSWVIREWNPIFINRDLLPS